MVTGVFSASDFIIDTPNRMSPTVEQNINELMISIPCDKPYLAKYRKS